MGVGGQHYAPGALLSAERPCTVRIAQGQGGPQDLSGRTWKTFPPPGFDLRTVHPVASLYTDYAIPAW
jgi:hypothetical protein